MTRFATGVVGAVIILGAIYWNVWSFFFLFLGITFFTLVEFYSLIKKLSCRPLMIYGTAAGPVIYSGIFLFQKEIIDSCLLWVILPLVILPFIVMLFYKSGDLVKDGSSTILGFIYIVLPFSLLHFLALDGGIYDYRPVLGIIFPLWANDTFAYLTGKAFGRHKLFEKVSPNKTREGALGGVAAAVIMGYLLYLGFGVFPLWKWLATAGLVAAAGTVGDLAESALKRKAGVKDSGVLLPGHGGFLDRFDGFLFAVPAAVVFLKLF